MDLELNLNELVSETEAARLVYVYRVTCLAQGKPHTEEGEDAIIFQLAESRYLCALLHLVMEGDRLVDFVDGGLLFHEVHPDDQEHLKENLAAIVIPNDAAEEEEEEND